VIDFATINNALKFLAENYGTFIALAFVVIFVSLALILIGLRGVIAWLFRIREIQSELHAIRLLLEKSSATSNPPTDRDGTKPKSERTTIPDSAAAMPSDAGTNGISHKSAFPLGH
jgi:hypothetical protein